MVVLFWSWKFEKICEAYNVTIIVKGPDDQLKHILEKSNNQCSVTSVSWNL